MGGGRKAMIKMETRIRELESELDAETRRFNDVSKNLRKSERSIKELAFASDEDRKNHERMQSLIDQLQGKVKSYKKQIEEAEEIAALNMGKYRKVAGALGDAEASADANEQAMSIGRPEPDLLLWDCNKSLGDIPRILYDHNLRHNWHILYYIPFQMRSILVPKMKTKTLSELILINVLMTYLQIDIQTYVYL